MFLTREAVRIITNSDHQNKPLAVLVDSYGTITKRDIGDQVVIKFAEPSWKEALDRYRTGEMSVENL